MAKILYLGASEVGSTSRHRCNALRRLGHHVVIADPYVAAGAHLQNRLLSAIHFRTGYYFLNGSLKSWILNRVRPSPEFDIAWVDGGELLDAESIRLLRCAGLSTVLYNHDDPTGKRDGRRFTTLLQALPFYDLCTVVRQENIQEYKAAGAKSVMHIWRSYDEVAHAPYEDITDIPISFRSEVAFIGTWMRGEGRDAFLLELLRRRIPVSIWGERWGKSPLWKQFKDSYRGHTLSGRDYVAAIQGAKVCLGMLSKGNRDLHTTRTMEIPYAGGVLCAERTKEHLDLYKDGVEAVFWGDIDECADQCRRLLDDFKWRESVRRAGMARVRAAHLGHEDICQLIVDAVLEMRS